MYLRLQLIAVTIGVVLGPFLVYGALSLLPPLQEFRATLATAVPSGIDIDVVFLFFLYLIAVFCGLVALEMVFVKPMESTVAWMHAMRTSGYRERRTLPSEGGALKDLHKEIGSAAALYFEMQRRIDVLTKLKNEVITVASHQLRTPLTELTWGVEALARKPEQAAVLSGGILAGLKRLTQAVKNLVDSFIIEEGTTGYVFAQIDLMAAMTMLISEQQAVAEHAGVALEYQHPATMPAMRGDKERLMIALGNIILNSILYTPQGGHIRVSIAPEDRRVIVRVEDSGIGIPEKELPLLFNKFVRGEVAKHMRPDGSGLGLYIAKNIIEAHHGDIRIESKQQHGTVVTVTLPYTF